MARVASIQKCDNKGVADPNGDHRMVVILIPTAEMGGSADDAGEILMQAHTACMEQHSSQGATVESVAAEKSRIDARVAKAIAIT
jgi:hypothetical protein